VGHRFTVDSVRLPRSFDLLFGRSVAGPLLLLKSAWLRETDLQDAKQNVVEFILGTRERLRHALHARHVPKSDGTLRLYTDFRKVNVVLAPNPFPYPGWKICWAVWDNRSTSRN